jgi:RNA polymerase sigma-70 factor (ECF subfamily)
LENNLPLKDETQMVALLKSKDRKAFSKLYDNYSPSLYGIILRIVQEEEMAQDVLQEVFLKIWDKMSSYEQGKGRLFTWMLNIARNAAIDKTRSAEFKKTARNIPLEDTIRRVERTNTSENKIEHIGIKSLIDKLKPEHRSIIDLVYLQGYTQSEVAEELNIPLGTVKTRVKLAINHLRELI